MTTKKTKIEKKAVEADVTNVKEDAPATPAARTIQSKTGMIAAMVDAMGKMPINDLSHWFNDAIAQIGKEAESIPDDAAEKNKASIAAKVPANAIKEDIAELFGSEEISEEFKDKAATLFEAAVNARVSLVLAEKEEEIDTLVESKVAERMTVLEKQVEDYMDYVAEQWMENNQVAVEESVQNEINSALVEDLLKVFERHHIQIPDEKLDIAEELASKVDALEEKLDEALNKNIELQNQVNTFAKDKAFAEVSEGLAATQVEKLRSLVEGFDIEEGVEDYKKKLGVVREQYFGTKNKPASTQIIVEDVDNEDDGSAKKPVVTDPQMNLYVNAIKRTVRKV